VIDTSVLPNTRFEIDNPIRHSFVSFNTAFVGNANVTEQWTPILVANPGGALF
jgi:hypothetical protein